MLVNLIKACSTLGFTCFDLVSAHPVGFQRICETSIHLTVTIPHRVHVSTSSFSKAFIAFRLGLKEALITTRKFLALLVDVGGLGQTIRVFNHLLGLLWRHVWVDWGMPTVLTFVSILFIWVSAGILAFLELGQWLGHWDLLDGCAQGGVDGGHEVG